MAVSPAFLGLSHSRRRSNHRSLHHGQQKASPRSRHRCIIPVKASWTSCLGYQVERCVPLPSRLPPTDRNIFDMYCGEQPSDSQSKVSTSIANSTGDPKSASGNTTPMSRIARCSRSRGSTFTFCTRRPSKMNHNNFDMYAENQSASALQYQKQYIRHPGLLQLIKSARKKLRSMATTCETARRSSGRSPFHASKPRP